MATSETMGSCMSLPLAGEAATVAIGDQVQQCYEIRRAVFQQEQKVRAELERDDMDKTAVHMLLRMPDSLEPVGTSRLLISSDGKEGKIGRVCVLKQHRRQGAGRAVVASSVIELRCAPQRLHALSLRPYSSQPSYEPPGRRTVPLA